VHVPWELISWNTNPRTWNINGEREQRTPERQTRKAGRLHFTLFLHLAIFWYFYRRFYAPKHIIKNSFPLVSCSSHFATCHISPSCLQIRHTPASRSPFIPFRPIHKYSTTSCFLLFASCPHAFTSLRNIVNYIAILRYAVGQLVEALRYKPEGREFDSRWSHKFFSDNPSGRTMVLGSTQPLTEMSTRNPSWG
jgi:hypothetical protein